MDSKPERRATRPLAATLLVALAILALGPVSAAPASSVRSENGRITYLAAPGEQNRLALDKGPQGPSGSSVTVTDPGAHIQVGPGCTASGDQVICAVQGTVAASLGDQDDSLRAPPDNEGERSPPRGPYTSVPFESPLDLEATLGSGNDRLAVAFNGLVTVAAGPGQDSVWSWSLESLARGGPGDDFIALSVDPGDAYGEAGNDRIIVDAESGGLLDGGPGNDRLTGGGDEPSLTYNGGAGNDTFNFVCDDPHCRGPRAGFADAQGGPGNDVFHTFPQPNPNEADWFAFISGGSGVDLVDYSKSTANLRITLDDQQNDGDDDVGGQDNVKSDVENVIAGRGNDHVLGSRFANLLDGNRGNDGLTGAGGRDLLLGGAGKDTIRSHDGEADVVRCGINFDVVFPDPLDSIAQDCEQF